MEPVADLAEILARLDAVAAELQAIRAELAAGDPDNCPDQHGVDDLSPEQLLDTHAAAARFGYPRDTVALWCRQGCGVKRGGRWMASVPRLQRRLNGG